MPSTPSSVKQVLVSTFLEVFSSIWSPQSLMRSEPELIVNFSILSNSFQEKKMPPITSPEDTIQLESRSSIWLWTESES